MNKMEFVEMFRDLANYYNDSCAIINEVINNIDTYPASSDWSPSGDKTLYGIRSKLIDIRNTLTIEFSDEVSDLYDRAVVEYANRKS